MAEQRKWRFPHNNYTNENGLDTSDMETFKRDPISSLAREICQNSIDAAAGAAPVIVEFKQFKIDRELVPGITELTEEISKCYQHKKSSQKEGKALEVLMRGIKQEQISCLRISDFNTTGVEGASSNARGTPFYNLTKGSGVSDKSGSSGGPEGIGKFASFVVSSTNTVFFSTISKDTPRAFLGISKLRSRPFDEEPDLLTMGTGYYSANDKNQPILDELKIDSSFVRTDSEYGTDVYIIGFNDNTGWEYDIITKCLESFMVAIMKGTLEITVEEYCIKNSTVKEMIFSEHFRKRTNKTDLRLIQAQYDLLQEDGNIASKELLISNNNSVMVYVKQYSAQDEEKSTKQCIMIR